MSEPAHGVASARAALARALSVPWVAAAILLFLACGLMVPAPAEQHHSWDDLIAPLAVGAPVARGYVLSPPRRGEQHNVVYVARRNAGADGPAGLVQIHIVERGRWPGAGETASFNVEFEVAPPGALVKAADDDARAVRDAFVAAIAKNDSGDESVDQLALASEPAPPPIARILDRLSGMRGAVIGASLALALVLLAAHPSSAAFAVLLLLLLGMALRLPVLDLPFLHDQDVQRLFTGNSSLLEIATGAGLKDRHPPLYFFLLHLMQRLGQAEAIGRFPAAVAGALIGPFIVLASKSMCGRIGAGALLVGLAATLSPELIARSREVSEIPLYSLIVIVAAASLVSALRQPRWWRLLTVALSHALALFTYYLAPFVLAAHAATLAVCALSSRNRIGSAAVFAKRKSGTGSVALAFLVGLIAGSPAIVLAVITFFRDRGAREAARAFPGLAWGQHSVVQMSSFMSTITAEAFGWPLVLLLVVAVVVGARRRDLAVSVPALGAFATFAGIALLASVARVQAYYITTVLPLVLLALAACADGKPAQRYAWTAALALVITFSTVPGSSRARTLYLPDADAFMPRFVEVIAQRPETKVIAVAHYDTALFAYYLARREGRSISWANLDGAATKRIEPLVLVHALDAGGEQAARARLDQMIEHEPLLVIERDAVLLPAIVDRLSRCERLLEAPTARLLRCGHP